MSSDILLEARTWIGTPFCHQGRLKQVSCDCIGLIMGVARHLQIRSQQGGLLHEYDTNIYARIPRDNILEYSLDMHLCTTDHLFVGAVALFSLNNHRLQHVGIISDYKDNKFGLIHAYFDIGRVAEHYLDSVWSNRLYKIYQL